MVKSLEIIGIELMQIQADLADIHDELFDDDKKWKKYIKSERYKELAE